jgi:hypothetical protein
MWDVFFVIQLQSLTSEVKQPDLLLISMEHLRHILKTECLLSWNYIFLIIF